MNKRGNEGKKGNKPIYNFDSFCESMANDLNKNPEKYDGLFLYTSNGVSQSDLNRLREGILERLSTGAKKSCYVMASPYIPNNLKRYDARNPEGKGWFTANVDWLLDMD